MLRKVVAVAIMCIGITGTLFASVSLCDYQAPTTDLTGLILSFYYNYLNEPTADRPEVSSGQLSLTFSRTQDTSQFGVSIESSNEIALDHLELTKASGETSATARAYVSDMDPLFGYAETRVAYGFADTQVQMRFGGGYGRIVDVTPMVRAMRIEQVLIEYQLVAGLPDSTLFGIADLISREAEYATLGELITEIQRSIETEVGRAVPVQVLLQIAEKVVGSEPEKQCGGTAQLGFGASIDRGFVRSSAITASFRFARALGLSSQLRTRADLSFPLSEQELRRFTASLRYDRRVSDIATFVAEYSAQWTVSPDRSISIGEDLRADLVLDVGKLTVTVRAGLARGTPARRWTESVLITASLDLA